MNRESVAYDYMDEIQALWPVSFDMQSIGMHIDVPALIQLRKDVSAGVKLREAKIQSMIGWIPNTKSPIDMGKVFDMFKIPYQLTPRSKKPKISKDTLLNMGAKYPAIRPVLSECLEITSRRTLASGFLGLALDQNDFYHPTYRLNATKTGRFAGEGADEGGPQPQNWPNHLRYIVIADDPLQDELTSADLKQAEGMFIAWDSEDIFWIRAFGSKKDLHCVRALVIFHNWNIASGLPADALIDTIRKVCHDCESEGLPECTHSERFISKQSGYAFSYGMGPRKFVTRILPPSGVFMSESDGRRIRGKVITPALERWQKAGDSDLRKSRWIDNAFGRRREFYGILDNSGDLVRELLSWKAQSVINVITSRAMIRWPKLAQKIKGTSNFPLPRISHTGHDSILINHRKQFRADVAEAVQEAFYQPITLHGRELCIPADTKSGPNWRMK